MHGCAHRPMKEVHAVMGNSGLHVVVRDKLAAMIRMELSAAKMIPNSAATISTLIMRHAVQSLDVVVLNAAMQAKPVVVTTTQ